MIVPAWFTIRACAAAAISLGALSPLAIADEAAKPDLGDVTIHYVETPREEKIRLALDDPIALQNGKASLPAFIALFAQRSGLPARVDSSTLEDYGVLVDDVEFVATDALPARVLLDETLPAHDLGWTIEADSLVVTVGDEISYRRRQRIYDVTSLSPQDDDPAVAAVYRDRQEELAEVIQATVSPDTWERRGGMGSLGTIRMNGKTLLVVSQSEQMFAKLELFLATLRKAAPETPGTADDAVEPVVPRVFPLSPNADDELVDVVRDFVAPESWTEEGAAIRRSSNTLLVRHRPAVQTQIRAMLSSMGVLAGGPGESVGIAIPDDIIQGSRAVEGGVQLPNPAPFPGIAP